MKRRRESMCVDDSVDHGGPSTAERLAGAKPAGPARKQSRASFANFQKMKNRRESMCIDDTKDHGGPSTAERLAGAKPAGPPRRQSRASFANFQKMKNRRESMCIDDTKDHGGPSTAEMLESGGRLGEIPEEGGGSKESAPKDGRMSKLDAKYAEARRMKEQLMGDFQSYLQRMKDNENMKEKQLLKLAALESIIARGDGAAYDFIRARLRPEDDDEDICLKDNSPWKGWKSIRNKMFLIPLLDSFKEGDTDFAPLLLDPNRVSQDPRATQTHGVSMDEFVAFLAREVQENPSMSQRNRQKIIAMRNLLARGSGPSYEFVNAQLKNCRKARRKSSFIQKKQSNFPHSNLLNSLIQKFMDESSMDTGRMSVRDRMESLRRQNTDVHNALTNLESVAEHSPGPGARKKKKRRRRTTVKVKVNRWKRKN